MKSTQIGPYPRIGSECGDRLRRELNKLYEGDGNAELGQSLMRDLTREVVGEMVSSGISLPNDGLIDVHDELTWPLEHVGGVEFGGMKKIFHTNTHYREAIVNGKVKRRESLLSSLYRIALETHPAIKVEFPGPYTMAKHSVLGKNSPYRSLDELAEAYAGLFREELLNLKEVPLVQFNEPSLIARQERVDTNMIRELYSKLSSGLNVPVAVWTYYGKYTPEILNMLFSLPVDLVGLDFVWNPELDEQLKNMSLNKEIGIGLIDSGDQGYIHLEDPGEILERLKRLQSQVDLSHSFLSSNATLEHLPREYARKKASLIGEVVRRVNR
ncbi:MAG: hypothetical protein V1857_04750 [archaeon]